MHILYTSNAQTNLMNLTKEEKAKMTELLAAHLAQDYYQKKDDGTFEPVWRGKNNEKQYRDKSPKEVAEMEGISEEAARERLTDLANDPYEVYSKYWKAQNRGGAAFLIELLSIYGAATMLTQDLNQEATQQELGDLIHQNWLERNPWVFDPEYGSPLLSKPFSELPTTEQIKDINQFRVFQSWLENYINLRFTIPSSSPGHQFHHHRNKSHKHILIWDKNSN